jgi:hypothetical protein
MGYRVQLYKATLRATLLQWIGLSAVKGTLKSSLMVARPAEFLVTRKYRLSSTRYPYVLWRIYTRRNGVLQIIYAKEYNVPQEIKWACSLT